MNGSELISVVICTHNRSQSLHGALRSLEELDVLSHLSWELLVVDNNCEDDTREAVAQYERPGRARPRYVFEPKLRLSNARNAGIRTPRSGIVCLLDDAVRVTPQWLAETKKGFDQYKPACPG